MSAHAAQPAPAPLGATGVAGVAGLDAVGVVRRDAAADFAGCGAGHAVDPVRRRTARFALAGAVGLGVLADLLFRDVPLGVNVAVWTACAVAGLAWLARRVERPVTVGAGLLGLVMLTFAGCVAWRDAHTLVALDLAALAAAAAALARALHYGNAWALEHADAGAYVAGAAAVARDVLGAAPAFATQEAGINELRTAHRARGLRTAVRGLALATPVLAVFGLLLVAADQTFEHAVGRVLDVDVPALASHAAWTAAAAWATAGFAASALFADATSDHPAPIGASADAPVAPGWLGRTSAAEVVVALGAVDALLLAFGAAQLGWLFGGRSTMLQSAVTHAEYARRGFFELATVAALSLPLLLAARSRVVRAVARGDGGAGALRGFRLTGGLLIALVVVLLASAADRMRLYHAAFGLTELRFYVSAFMAWLLAVFGWAAATLLRERPAPFALGGLLLGWAWVLALNVANPSAVIARVNIARAEAGRAFDADYLTTLGADAVPALAARAWPRVAAGGDKVARCSVARAILDARGADAGGWRGGNFARTAASRAARAVDAERAFAEHGTTFERACAAERGPTPPAGDAEAGSGRGRGFGAITVKTRGRRARRLTPRRREGDRPREGLGRTAHAFCPRRPRLATPLRLTAALALTFAPAPALAQEPGQRGAARTSLADLGRQLTATWRQPAAGQQGRTPSAGPDARPALGRPPPQAPARRERGS